MAASILSPCNSFTIQGSTRQNPLYSRLFLGLPRRILHQPSAKRHSYRFSVLAATEGSAKSSKSDESVPSWAKPDSNEPPPWAKDEGKGSTSSQQGVEFPFGIYLIASAVTAIAAIGSIFEYVNQRPVFGVVNPDSIFYVPLLGFFVFTGLPLSGFLWYKSVQVANKEAEEQDKRDGYL